MILMRLYLNCRRSFYNSFNKFGKKYNIFYILHDII